MTDRVAERAAEKYKTMTMWGRTLGLLVIIVALSALGLFAATVLPEAIPGLAVILVFASLGALVCVLNLVCNAIEED